MSGLASVMVYRVNPEEIVKEKKYHSCLVLRTSKPSKSLRWCHPIQTTTKPEDESLFLLVTMLLLESDQINKKPLSSLIYATCKALPAANAVVSRAALVPGSRGGGMTIRAAAVK